MTAPRPKTRLEMPFLLLCGMGFSAFFAGVGALVMGLMLPIVLLGNGPYTSNGVEVDKATFLRDSAALFILMPLLLTAYGVIAYGLWKERTWTRTAIMGFWGAMFLMLVVVGLMVPSEDQNLAGTLMMFAVWWGVAAWYCYGKESVVAYFKAVDEQELARTASTGPVASAPQAP